MLRTSFGQCGELKVLQQTFYFACHCRKVCVVSKCRTKSSSYKRLVRVDFPRMKVNHYGLAFHVVYVSNCPACRAVWTQSEISTPSDTQIVVCGPDRRRRKLK